MTSPVESDPIWIDEPIFRPDEEKTATYRLRVTYRFGEMLGYAWRGEVYAPGRGTYPDWTTYGITKGRAIKKAERLIRRIERERRHHQINVTLNKHRRRT